MSVSRSLVAFLRRRSLLPVVVGLAFASAAAVADEGMWLVNQPPLRHLEEHHGFRPEADWLLRMQRAAVRFENGGSGSFVSDEGLVLTNHHVGFDLIEKLSTAERNLVRDGFLAATREEELPCPDLELRVLWSIEDVTDRVDAAAAGLGPAEAFAARRRAIAEIEQEAQERTGLVAEVVTLYQGGRFHLYLYRSYTDVRLVFAPELAAASFGGDPDNFEYPRHCLDMALFRVYVDGAPLRPEAWLRASPAGISEGALALVFGHPGRTQRALTVDHLKFVRDRELPMLLDWTCRNEVRIASFAEEELENARQAEGLLLGIANGRKARTGMLAALQDPAFMRAKAAEEASFRERLEKHPEARALASGAWEEVAASVAAYGELLGPYQALEVARGAGQLFRFARTLVRLAAESQVANADRLPEYRDTARASLELELFSDAPIHPAVEGQQLASWLTKLAQLVGGDDDQVRAALGDTSPEERGPTLARLTTLADPATRRALAAAGPAGVASTNDPLIRVARDIDARARDLRTRYEDRVLGPQREAYARIARARFLLDGESVYPDATFTLRLSFGPVKGYSESDQRVAPFTTLGEAFEKEARHGGRPPFLLPPSWHEHKADLDLSTPFNFVCTADIIGGNSGSPVVDAKGDLVGLIFDGNIQSLAWDYRYDDRQGRAVAVDIRGILETMRSIYGAGALADEMLR